VVSQEKSNWSRRNKSWKTVLKLVLVLACADIVIAAIDPTPNREIAIGFIAFVIQFALTVLLGLLIGTALAGAILKSQTLPHFLVNGLWLAQWFAVIGLWATWYVSTVGFTGAVAATVYYTILFNTSIEQNPSLRRLLTAKEVTSYCLLVILVVHTLEPTGFAWFAVLSEYGELRALAALSFVVFTIYIKDALLPGNSVTSEVLGCERASTKNQSHRNLQWLGLGFFFIVLVVLLLRAGGSALLLRAEVWFHIGVSLFEVTIGLVLSLGLASLLDGTLKKHANLRTQPFHGFQFTYLIPIMIIPLLLKYGILSGIWLTVSAVFALTFFPCFRIMWYLQADGGANRRLASLSEALPYAFVGMLFGETLHATRGLGFAMIATTEFDQRLTICLVTTMLLALTFAVTRASLLNIPRHFD
jgi:ABC-type nitrate/sulfonate/bicarbonate transport system permease component